MIKVKYSTMYYISKDLDFYMERFKHGFRRKGLSDIIKWAFLRSTWKDSWFGEQIMFHVNVGEPTKGPFSGENQTTESW